MCWTGDGLNNFSALRCSGVFVCDCCCRVVRWFAIFIICYHLWTILCFLILSIGAQNTIVIARIDVGWLFSEVEAWLVVIERVVGPLLDEFVGRFGVDKVAFLLLRDFWFVGSIFELLGSGNNSLLIGFSFMMMQVIMSLEYLFFLTTLEIADILDVWIFWHAVLYVVSVFLRSEAINNHCAL